MIDKRGDNYFKCRCRIDGPEVVTSALECTSQMWRSNFGIAPRCELTSTKATPFFFIHPSVYILVSSGYNLLDKGKISYWKNIADVTTHSNAEAIWNMNSPP